MKRLLFALSLVVLSACTAEPPPPPPEPGDPVAVDPRHYSVIFENDTVRLLKITYEPGESSVLHRHPDSVVVVLSGSTTRFTNPDGTTEDVNLPTDSALYLPAGAHNSQNVGATRTEAVLVELKSAAAPAATLPTERPGMAMTSLAEGPRAAAFRITADASFAEPAGTTHDYDQVVIALSPAEVPLTIDGALAKSTWARGDVQFIGRGVAHESQNKSGGPVEFVIVAIR